MKLLKKVKKGIVGIGAFMISIHSKVLASVQPAYGGKSTQPDYGVREPNVLHYIWNIAKIFIIPLALLIGLIVYFKKSKSSRKKKIIVSIFTIILVVIIYFIINNIFAYIS